MQTPQRAQYTNSFHPRRPRRPTTTHPCMHLVHMLPWKPKRSSKRVFMSHALRKAMFHTVASQNYMVGQRRLTSPQPTHYPGCYFNTCMYAPRCNLPVRHAVDTASHEPTLLPCLNGTFGRRRARGRWTQTACRILSERHLLLMELMSTMSSYRGRCRMLSR